MRSTPLIVGIIIVILIGVGVYALSNNTPTTLTDTTNATGTMQMPADDGDGDNDATVGATSSATSASSTTVTSNTATVAIKNFAYSPVTITIKKGTKVTWTNNDTAPHTVTSDAGDTAGVLNSPTLSTGQSYSLTFARAGTFPYHCTIHPNMKATVIVTE